MGDIADRSQQDSDLYLSIQLQRRHPALDVTGYCHWCSDKAPADAKFCDAECRDDFDKNQRRRG